MLTSDILSSFSIELLPILQLLVLNKPSTTNIFHFEKDEIPKFIQSKSLSQDPSLLFPIKPILPCWPLPIKNQTHVCMILAAPSYILSMSFEKEVEIYSYTLTLLNLTLKVKFPCRLYLEHQGRPLTSEVTPTPNNKFIFNQEVTLKNDSDKKHIELVVQLLTEKGNKYVGGVVRLAENELVASEGECMAVPVSKCLDGEAVCELRVDQVATSRVVRKGSPKRAPLRSEYQPDLNVNLYSSQKQRQQEGQTKSQFNFPISMARREKLNHSKDPMVVVNSVRRGFKGDESRIDKQGMGSIAGGAAVSALEFEVYKEGYNKLKEKYRKETESARSEMNKRLALENNENNLKLEVMRYKLKAEQLEKTVSEKTMKIKQLSETITSLQKKQLDSKYLKEEAENKSYTIKSLEQTIRSLNKDNNQLKALQTQKYQSEQETIQSLRDQVDKAKRALQDRENEIVRQLKIKNDAISKLEYALHNKVEELERAKCNIDDLDKTITNKTFEWEKVLQGERNAAISKQDELKQKIEALKDQKKALSERITQLEQSLQDKKNQLSKTQYDKKIVIQNSEVLQKENQQLKAIKDKYTELGREHKATLDEKAQLEKAKQKETKIKDTQIQQLSEKIRILTEANKKSVKDLQQKLKVNQVKLIENDSQNENLKNQLQKLKRQSQSIAKENNDLKSQLRDLKADIKVKQATILTLTNDLSTANNKSSQEDQASKQELSRLKEEIEKLSSTCNGLKENSTKDAATISQLELAIKKSKVEIQYREERAARDSNYSKEKIASLQAFKTDLQSQIEALTQNTTALKNNQKILTEKIQKLELQAIKNKEGSEKLKKQIKILQQKLQNNDVNQKNKAKQFADLQAIKEKVEKRVTELQTEIGNLKNDLNKEVIEKKRLEKIVQILQGDLAKAKEDQAKLNGIIAQKESIEVSLREDIKKQKQEFTKLDMKYNGLKKQFDKFKETLTDNLNTVFSSIPEGLLGSQSRLKPVINDKSSIRENSDVLNLLISYGREARLNMTRTIDQLKQSIRDNEKLNSDYSITVNKSNTAEFEYSQNITQIQQEMAELLQEKTRDQNKYEQDIFLLEGRIREKDATISDLTEQVEQFDFLLKNNRTQFELYRQETYRKEAAKNKLVEELREQVQYQHGEMENLEHSLEKYQQNLEASEIQLISCKQTIEKLNKQNSDAKDYISQLEDSVAALKKEIKKTSERCEELSMGLAHKEEELKKNEQVLQEEERKAAELRDFLKVLMRQKEEIIKNQLQKSEKALELETSIEQMKHEIETLQDAIKASKNCQEQQRETIKKLTKSLKEQELARQQERTKGSKLADKLKEKEKEIIAKDDALAKLEERAKKESEKKAKQIKQLESELDSTYQKMLASDREASEQILALTNALERKTVQNQKLTESLVTSEESLFRERSKSQQLKQQITALQNELNVSESQGNQLRAKIQALNEELRINEEQLFKLQGKINLLQMKLEMKENESINRIENLNQDWSSKYFSMEEQYEQRLELAVKQRDFLKEKLADSEKEIKKLTAQLRSQEVTTANIKKSWEDKVKSLEQDRLATMAEKNLENQRLVDQVRTSFDGLKQKESECRKLNSELELVKANLVKIQGKWKESEEKIRNLNRNYQSEAQQMRKKETNFKKLKETITNSQWKAQREVRKLVQNSSRQIIELVDEKNTIKVMQISKVLQQSILATIALKLDDKDI